MIETIHIENYKSIHSLDVPLGRVTVLIGENGCGKSNILEAIALAGAASQNKLDNEFLASRGIRVSPPKFMRSAFKNSSGIEDIKIEVSDGFPKKITYILKNDNNVYSKWKLDSAVRNPNVSELESILQEQGLFQNSEIDIEISSEIIGILIKKQAKRMGVLDYLIYSPENTALRTFEKEAQIEPLGINGEGLYKLLRVTADMNPDKLEIVKEHLRLLGWFEDFDLPDSKYGEYNLVVKDKYITEDLGKDLYTHKNTNEGFLFVLFYILLLVSDETPSFFAIDNIDASLNPKLCTEITKCIVKLAKEFNKQVILTTHNPAILDGINLHDDEQKILIVSRNSSGHTKVRNLKPPKVSEGEVPIKLSEAFLNGMIGGLPKSF